MTARAEILAAIRTANVPLAPAAGRMKGEAGLTDLREQFCRVLASVGGVGIVCPANQSVDELLAQTLGDEHPMATVVPGRFAVAENGAVYVESADLADRAAIVLAEHLVLVVPAAAVVATMHEAVRLIPGESRCGWLLSGPSKTADIEQALVIGAQGARTLRVVLRG